MYFKFQQDSEEIHHSKVAGDSKQILMLSLELHQGMNPGVISHTCHPNLII